MLVAERIYSGELAATETLILPFDLRCKSRLRTQLASGEEIGLFLSPGTVLRGGARLEANDGRIVAITAADEPLMEVRCATPLLLARAAYHLGNRHVAVQLDAGWLRLQPDHVLRQMLLGLGATITELAAPFEPEAGAYSPGHQHDTMHGKGKIHMYGNKRS